jgi:hypothetical protein
MDYRTVFGEKITPKSPVMRDLFHPDRGAKGDPHLPKRCAVNGTKRLIEHALRGRFFERIPWIFCFA